MENRARDETHAYLLGDGLNQGSRIASAAGVGLGTNVHKIPRFILTVPKDLVFRLVQQRHELAKVPFVPLC